MCRVQMNEPAESELGILVHISRISMLIFLPPSDSLLGSSKCKINPDLGSSRRYFFVFVSSYFRSSSHRVSLQPLITSFSSVATLLVGLPSRPSFDVLEQVGSETSSVVRQVDL